MIIFQTIRDRWRGARTFRNQPNLAASWEGGFNAQTGRQQIFHEVFALLKPASIVETGTYRGATTQWLAEAVDVPIFTVEADAELFGFAKSKLKQFRHVHIAHNDSRQYLQNLFGGKKLPQGRVFCYLDAHWEQDLPLAEEIDLVFRATGEAVVMVDDFAVPHDKGYRLDDYGSGRTLNVDYIADVVERHDLQMYFPSLESEAETGARRGSVILVRSPKAVDLLNQAVSLRRFVVDE